jgi:hypothetical protein
MRVSKAHCIGNSPSQHNCKLPELSNDASFDSGVILAVEMWHFQVQNFVLFGSVGMAPMSWPRMSPKPIELVTRPPNMNVTYPSFPMIPHLTQGSYWWWRCGTFKFKIHLFGCLCCHGTIVSTLRSPKHIELVTRPHNIKVEYWSFPMIPHSTQGSYLRWRYGTFKFKICFVGFCCRGDFPEAEWYIKEKESEQVKGTAAQIIHIQNIVCQTIVKEPQNEVWLVECWNCEKTSE